MSSEHQATEDATYSLSTSITPTAGALGLPDHRSLPLPDEPPAEPQRRRRHHPALLQARPDQEHSQADRFIFELDAEHQWWVIVELRDVAFFQEAEKHRALTVFAKGADHDLDEGWSL